MNEKEEREKGGEEQCKITVGDGLNKRKMGRGKS